MWYIKVTVGRVGYWIFTAKHAIMSAHTIFLGPNAEYAEAFEPSSLMRMVWAVEQMFPNGLVETIECSSKKLIPENLQWFYVQRSK